jgi:glycosyl transferase family 25
MKIYVINLDRSPDRMAHMTKALGELGLPFERFPAVDGRQLPKEELSRYAATHRRTVPWLPGDIGNSLSHIRLWEKIAAGGPGWTLIFEDDVSISTLLPTFLAHFEANQVPRNAMVKIETTGSNVILSKRSTAKLGSIDLYRLRTPHMGTAGYLIEREMAEKWARNHTLLDDPIDAIWKPWLTKQLGGVLLQAVPALVVQDDFDRRGKKLGLPSVVTPERAGRAREARWAKFKRTVRDFPKRGVVVGPRLRIPFAE